MPPNAPPRHSPLPLQNGAGPGLPPRAPHVLGDQVLHVQVQLPIGFLLIFLLHGRRLVRRLGLRVGRRAGLGRASVLGGLPARE